MKLKYLLGSLFLLSSLSFAQSLPVNVVDFPSVTSVNNLLTTAPGYQVISIDNIRYPAVIGQFGLGTYRWQNTGCGTIDNLFWIQPAGTSPGCFKMAGFAATTAFSAVAYSGNAADLTGGPLPASVLPYPTTTTLGGIKAATGLAGQFVNGVDALGNPTFNTPVGSGNVIGPALSTTNNCAKFADTTGKLIADSGGTCGGGNPAGSNTQLQYNNSSVFGGITGATTDGTSVTFALSTLKLAGSGGMHQVVQQSTSGGALTVAQLSGTDISGGSLSNTSGAPTAGSTSLTVAGLVCTGSTTNAASNTIALQALLDNTSITDVYGDPAGTCIVGHITKTTSTTIRFHSTYLKSTAINNTVAGSNANDWIDISSGTIVFQDGSTLDESLNQSTGAAIVSAGSSTSFQMINSTLLNPVGGCSSACGLGIMIVSGSSIFQNLTEIGGPDSAWALDLDAASTKNRVSLTAYNVLGRPFMARSSATTGDVLGPITCYNSGTCVWTVEENAFTGINWTAYNTLGNWDSFAIEGGTTHATVVGITEINPTGGATPAGNGLTIASTATAAPTNLTIRGVHLDHSGQSNLAIYDGGFAHIPTNITVDGDFIDANQQTGGNFHSIDIFGARNTRVTGRCVIDDAKSYYCYQEVNGVSTSANNSFVGHLEAGSSGIYALVAATSSVLLTDSTLTYSKLGAGFVQSSSTGGFSSSTISTANLSDVSSGTWTPTDVSGGSLTFTYSNCTYYKIGKLYTVFFDITWPTTSDMHANAIGGLPGSGQNGAGVVGYTSIVGNYSAYIAGTLQLYLSSHTQSTNAVLSTSEFRGTAQYYVP